jgi:predicted nucleotidyltransferase
VIPSDRLADLLGAFPEVLFALVFGSRAEGTARPDSDVDVAVFLTPETEPRERWDARLEIAAALEALGRVDLVVLNDAPPLLAHRALRGVTVLMRDRRAYVRFFVRTLAMAEDERHGREIHRKARMERLKEGRFGRP